MNYAVAIPNQLVTMPKTVIHSLRRAKNTPAKTSGFKQAANFITKNRKSIGRIIGIVAATGLGLSTVRDNLPLTVNFVFCNDPSTSTACLVINPAPQPAIHHSTHDKSHINPKVQA
jgi:hypothetical protein